MSEEIKIELSFTMKEMEDYLLHNFPRNYHWKDHKKEVMVYGSDIVVEDIKEEFVKCFKETLLRQRYHSGGMRYR